MGTYLDKQTNKKPKQITTQFIPWNSYHEF